MDGAVITVPSIFTDRQRSAIINIAEKSGFTTVKLVNDPMAALLGAPYIEDASNLLVAVNGCRCYQCIGIPES